MEELKRLVSEYCQSEGWSEPDFSNLERVAIGYTTSGDGTHSFQMYANLVGCQLIYELDGKDARTVDFGVAPNVFAEVLGALDFEGVVAEFESIVEMRD